MLDKFTLILTEIDLLVSENLNFYLDPYFPNSDVSGFAQYIPVITKILLYLTFLILPFSILKFLHPDSSNVNAILITLLISAAFTVAGIFFGFLQLMYS